MCACFILTGGSIEASRHKFGLVRRSVWFGETGTSTRVDKPKISQHHPTIARGRRPNLTLRINGRDCSPWRLGDGFNLHRKRPPSGSRNLHHDRAVRYSLMPQAWRVARLSYTRLSWLPPFPARAQLVALRHNPVIHVYTELTAAGKCVRSQIYRSGTLVVLTIMPVTLNRTIPAT